MWPLYAVRFGSWVGFLTRLWSTGEFLINRRPTGWRDDWRILHAASAGVHSSKFLCSTGEGDGGRQEPKAGRLLFEGVCTAS